MNQAAGNEANPLAIMSAHSGVHTSASAVGTILSISPIEDDHNSLERIFSEFRWTLHRFITLPSAMAFLAKRHAPVVICERDLAPGNWKDMLDWAARLPQPPRVIVTSRLADEYLWAEALHVGAYDVLAKPFNREEVIRTVSMAFDSWHAQRLRARAAG